MLDAGRGDESLRLAQGFRELRQRLRRDFAKNVRTNSNIVGYGLTFIDAFMHAYAPGEPLRRAVKLEIKAEDD